MSKTGLLRKFCFVTFQLAHYCGGEWSAILGLHPLKADPPYHGWVSLQTHFLTFYKSTKDQNEIKTFQEAVLDSFDSVGDRLSALF